MRRALLILAFIIWTAFLPGDAQAAVLAIGLAGAGLGAGVGAFFGLTGMALLTAASLGWSIGSIVGGMIFAPQAPTMRGPRLADRSVTSSAYGAHIHFLQGTDRLNGNVIFSSDLIEKLRTEEVSAGKGLGGSSQSLVTPTYSVDMTIAFCKKAQGVRKIWADTKLIYDVGENPTLEQLLASNIPTKGGAITVRDGNESQLPSALEESYLGVGNVSAHRGLFCLEFKNFALADFANRIPNITAELFTDGSSTFGIVGSYDPIPTGNLRAMWSYVSPEGEIWELIGDAGEPFAEFPDPDVFTINHYFPDGTVVQEPLVPATERVTGSFPTFYPGQSDEPSYLMRALFGGVWSYWYYSIPRQAEIICTPPADESNRSIVRWVKEGDDIFVYAAKSIGAPTALLWRFDARTGAYIETSDVVSALSGFIIGISATQSSIYMLREGASGDAEILRIDRNDLYSIADTYALTGIDGTWVGAVFAESDSRLHVSYSDIAGRVNFLYYDVAAAAIVLVGGPVILASSTFNASFGGRNMLSFQSGIYFVGINGVAGFTVGIDAIGTSVTVNGVPLWKIVRDRCVVAGLDVPMDTTPPADGDINVDELIDIVHGYTATRPMSDRDYLTPLQQVYFFDGRESGDVIEFPKRGKPAVETVPTGDLAVRGSLKEALPDRLTILRGQETEKPLRVHVVYNNREFNYLQGHEYASRLTTESDKVVNVEISVAITATEARRSADVLQAMDWLERESFNSRSSRKHLLPDPADNVEIIIEDEF